MSTGNELTRLIPGNNKLLNRDIENSRPTTNGSTDDGTDSRNTLGNSSSFCGDCLKSLVFGAHDGILSSLVIVSAASGANLSWRVVVVIAVACALSSSISTGINEFLSSRAHRDYIQAEKRRELWEYKNFKEAQIAEMVNRFESRGMSRRDAEIIVTKMSQYENFFVGLMVAEDLGLQLAEDNDATFITDAFVMFASYGCFASIPIIIVCFSSYLTEDIHVLYLLAAGVSLSIMLTLGIVKSYISSSSWMISGIESLLLGALSSGLAYFLGYKLMALLMG